MEDQQGSPADDKKEPEEPESSPGDDGSADASEASNDGEHESAYRSFQHGFARLIRPVIPGNRQVPFLNYKESEQEKKHRRLQKLLRQRQRLHIARAAAVGLLAGGVAVLFEWALTGMEYYRAGLLGWMKDYPWWGWIVMMAFGGVLGGLAGYLTTRFAPEASGSGIPHVKAVLHNVRTLRWKRLLPVKFFGGALGIGGGLSLGREGPTVQMGAAIGQAVAELLKLTKQSRSHLIACGAGAGLAAAFNAPLAGFIFIIEELRQKMSPITYGTALIAAVSADVITRSFTGQQPAFHISGYPTPPLTALPLFALVGLLTGIGGVFFNRSLLWSMRRFDSWDTVPKWARPALVGAVAGLVVWWFPEAVGSGHSVAETILNSKYAALEHLDFIILLLVVKTVLTLLSYSSGAPGGIFAPLLVFGALLGLLVGQASVLWFPELAQNPAAFAVVGMASYFAAIVRAPLTGIVLILEMTGNYEQLFALLISCMIAYLVAEYLRARPIYETLLEYSMRGKAQAQRPKEE